MISITFTKSIQATGIVLAGLLLTAGAFFASPQQASAQSVEDMSVEQLIALIQQLQQLIADLSTGSDGDEDGSLVVRASNADLASSAFFLAPDEDTGIIAFAFDLDASDSDNEIEVSEFFIEVDVSAGQVGDFIEDVVVLVDGNEIELDDVDISTDGIGVEIDSGELFIDEGERVTVEIEIEFNALSADDQGVIIDFAVAGSDFEAEGLDDVSVEGFVASAAHQLLTGGLVIDSQSVETETFTQGDNDEIGVFEIEFEATAVEDDFEVAALAALAGTAQANQAGLVFSVVGARGGAIEIEEIEFSSTADESSIDTFSVPEGETETFVVTVSVRTEQSGFLRLELDEINFTGSNDSDVSTLKFNPASDFRTGFENINASDNITPETQADASIEIEVTDLNADFDGATGAQFEVVFEVEADNGDVFIAKEAGYRGSSLDRFGVHYFIKDENNKVIRGRDIADSASLTSTANEVQDFFVVTEGEVEEFTLSVDLKDLEVGEYKLQFHSVNFAETASNPTNLVRLPTRIAVTDLINIEEIFTEDVSIDLEVLDFDTDVIESGSGSSTVAESITLTAEFEVEADEGDVFIRNQAFFRGNKLGTPGFHYLLVDSDKKLVRGNLSKRKAVVTSTADKQGKFFVVEEGETETFTLEVELTNLQADEYGLRLFSTNFATSAVDPTELVRFSNREAFGPVIDAD